MKRAAILIGVHQVKKLPTLRAVLDGVKRMEEWALAQGMPRELVRKITDADGERVTGQDVEDAVMEVLNTDGLEQLLIYFAGHGVNIGYQEYWLLTLALECANHSVNVAGSIERAKHCGVKHVVLLSDCCRTAPKTIREQGTKGTIIFPNPVAGAERSHVDVFYATRLGEPSLEIKDQDIEAAAGMFRAVYTDATLDALNGVFEEICEVDQKLGVKVVRPWPFSKKLLEDVPARVHELTNSLLRTQVPDSNITSDPTESWLSDISKATRTSETKFVGSNASLRAASLAVADVDATEDFVRAAIEKDDPDLPARLAAMRPTPGAEISASTEREQFADAAVRNAESFGPFEFESQCGFKVRGAQIDEIVCNTGYRLHDDRRAVGIESTETPTSVLLVFESGYGALVACATRFHRQLDLGRGQPFRLGLRTVQ